MRKSTYTCFASLCEGQSDIQIILHLLQDFSVRFPLELSAHVAMQQKQQKKTEQTIIKKYRKITFEVSQHHIEDFLCSTPSQLVGETKVKQKPWKRCIIIPTTGNLL